MAKLFIEVTTEAGDPLVIGLAHVVYILPNEKDRGGGCIIKVDSAGEGFICQETYAEMKDGLGGLLAEA